MTQPTQPTQHTKLLLSPGSRLGELLLVSRVRTSTNAKSYKKKQWRVECSCGVRLTVPEWYLVRPSNPKRSCGHYTKTSKTIYNREYRIWCMMHQRCLFPTHVAYKHYGRRGIKIHYDFLGPDYGGNPDGKGFDRFLACVGPAPSLKHSIDRINVNEGYAAFQSDGVTPQLRWATAVEQAANKRPT